VRTNNFERNFFYFGVFFLFFGVVAFVSYLFVILRSNHTNLLKEKDFLQNYQERNSTNSGKKNFYSKVYQAEEYNFRFLYPGDLVVRKVNVQDSYLLSLKFEETKLSDNKGIALGVSKKTAAKEIEDISRIFEKEGGELVDRGEIEIGGVRMLRFDFKPKFEGNFQEKSLVVFSKGDLTYSISTTPDQIMDVLLGFSFLN